ncbi:MAG: hypothetical protein MJ252_15010 [archaeon]|nr:hypothetical protein [archaeon]
MKDLQNAQNVEKNSQNQSAQNVELKLNFTIMEDIIMEDIIITEIMAKVTGPMENLMKVVHMDLMDMDLMSFYVKNAEENNKLLT